MGTLPSSAILEWLQAMRAQLDDVTASLRARFPSVEIHSFGGPVGSLTEFQAHHVGLEALLPSSDCVALSITAAYLTTESRVFGDVCWGTDAGGITEASTCEGWRSSTEWPLASADNLASVEQALPRLLDALFSAIDRGRPSP